MTHRVSGAPAPKGTETCEDCGARCPGANVNGKILCSPCMNRGLSGNRPVNPPHLPAYALGAVALIIFAGALFLVGVGPHLGLTFPPLGRVLEALAIAGASGAGYAWWKALSADRWASRIDGRWFNLLYEHGWLRSKPGKGHRGPGRAIVVGVPLAVLFAVVLVGLWTLGVGLVALPGIGMAGYLAGAQANVVGAPSMIVGPSAGLPGGPLNRGASYGPDTAGTTTCGIEEALNFVATEEFIQGYGDSGCIKLLPGQFNITTGIVLPNAYVNVWGSGKVLSQIMCQTSGMTAIKNPVAQLFTHRDFRDFSVHSNGIAATAFDIEMSEGNGQNVFQHVTLVGTWSAAPIKWVGAENSLFVDVSVEQNSGTTYLLFSIPGGSIYFDDCQFPNLQIAAQNAIFLNTTHNSIQLCGNTNTLALYGSYQANPFTGPRIDTNGYTLYQLISLNSMHGLGNSSPLFDGGGGTGGAGGTQINSITMKSYISVIDSTTCGFCGHSDGNGFPYPSSIDFIGSYLSAGSGTLSGFNFLTSGGIVVSNRGWNMPTAPAVPSSGSDAQNTFPFPVRVYVTGVGSGITAYGITDAGGTLKSFTDTVAVGMFFVLGPGEKIRLTYTGSPTWSWFGP